VSVAKRFILIADDVRTEDNGKAIVIGLYGPDILTAKVPLAMPLAFLAGVAIKSRSKIKLRGSLTHLDSGRELLSFGAEGETRGNTNVLIPFKFPVVTFEKPGLYEVSLQIEGQEEPLTERFSVVLKGKS
jgi:hypothetical protein